MAQPISVITLASYDAHMLPDSIKSYYDYVDEIIIGLDEDRISWSKNAFSFDENKLWSELKKIDKEGKTSIIEDNFHSSNIPIENDNYERNFLKAQCTHDWVMSFDADEVLVNAKEFFTKFVPVVEPYYDKVDLVFTWFLPYKQIEDITLVIANNDGSFFKGDTQGFATKKDNVFTYCRWTNNKKMIKTPLAVMHWSFCRKQKELETKLANYGHSDRTGEDPFYHNWRVINLENYMNLRNFKTSGMGENQWERLVKVPTNQLGEVARQQAASLY